MDTRNMQSNVKMNESFHFHQEHSTVNRNSVVMANDEMSETLIPVVVYISILMVLGIAGNTVVCYIYLFKWKARTVKYFIGCLASLDLVTCLFCMPAEIAMLRNPLLLDDPVLCKFLRFTRATTSLAAGFMLVVIAFDRFRRICRHNMWQVDVKLARRMCYATLFLGLLFSWPCFLIFGSLDRSGIVTIETSCSTDRDLAGTLYPTIFYGIVLLCFLFISVSLVTFYTIIGVRLCRMPVMTKSTTKRYSVTESTNSSQNDTPDVTKEFLQNDKTNTDSLPRSKFAVRNGKNSTKRKPSNLDFKTRFDSIRRSSSLRFNRMRQTTTTLFLITMIQWLSFFPYIGLLICRSVIPDFMESMSPEGQTAYNIGILSHFLSSGINPFIYGFLGRDFRDQCKTTLNEFKKSLQRADVTVSSPCSRDN